MENNITSIIGYHGTILDIGTKILKENKFQKKHNPEHWLGQGVYFFENGYSDACWWCQNRRFNPRCILKVLIQAKIKEIFNLDTTDDMNKLNSEYHKVCKILDDNNYGYKNTEQGMKVICSIIDFYTEENDEILLIKKTFPHTKNNSILGDLDDKYLSRHTQICVKNTNAIKEIKEAIK